MYVLLNVNYEYIYVLTTLYRKNLKMREWVKGLVCFFVEVCVVIKIIYYYVVFILVDAHYLNLLKDLN